MPVCVRVGLRVDVGVNVLVTVCVGVRVGVRVDVVVHVPVGVCVQVRVGVVVGESVCVEVHAVVGVGLVVGVAVGVRVAVPVKLAVVVAVGEAGTILVGVGVGVGVKVGAAVGPKSTTSRIAELSPAKTYFEVAVTDLVVPGTMSRASRNGEKSLPMSRMYSPPIESRWELAGLARARFDPSSATSWAP